MSLTYDQKNANILSRFESDLSEDSAKSYSVIFKNGRTCTMICMAGENRLEAERKAKIQFGSDRVDYVKV